MNIYIYIAFYVEYVERPLNTPLQLNTAYALHLSSHHQFVLPLFCRLIISLISTLWSLPLFLPLPLLPLPPASAMRTYLLLERKVTPPVARLVE